ncbi:hypothetical protein OOT46_13445 [Aquabacterium sp. A7-Y]|uniref:hypothetical protein n=1 Tax=Aquabacterium sp. A7-Y TaxID=1349605 RepID=UPI00223D2AC7|nr:hypothetical protein [Aquabacterium sp. A7-Y]MCW7538844.1 hypothetical protein [Aquabacterium sp. A7-Y]
MLAAVLLASGAAADDTPAEGEALALAAPLPSGDRAAEAAAAALPPGPLKEPETAATAGTASAPSAALQSALSATPGRIGPLAAYRAAPMGGVPPAPGLTAGGEGTAVAPAWQPPPGYWGAHANQWERAREQFEWAPSPSARWGIARGGLRLRFDDHSSLSLRIRRNGVGAYWRARF